MNQNGRKSLSARLSFARLAAILLLSVGACSTAAVAQGRTATPNFGPNVYIFSPSTPAAQVQSTLSRFRTKHSSAPIAMPCSSCRARTASRRRWATMSRSRAWGKSRWGHDRRLSDSQLWRLRYGTSTWPGANITDTFWRSMENMTIDVATDTEQNANASTLQWGVSQGAPLRRM